MIIVIARNFEQARHYCRQNGLPNRSIFSSVRALEGVRPTEIHLVGTVRERSDWSALEQFLRRSELKMKTPVKWVDATKVRA